MAKKAYYINSTLARYTDEEFAWFQSLFLNEGIIGAAVGGALGFQVLEQTPVPNMQLRVTAGKGLVELTTGGRTFKCVVESNATENLTVAGNSTGSNRVDAIILRLDKDAEPDALKSNVFTIEVITGAGITALADGAIDTIVSGDGWYRLANVTVANGAVQIFNASIADVRAKVNFNNGLAFAAAFIASSTGVADAGKYPMLNADGLIDISMLNPVGSKVRKFTALGGTSTITIASPAVITCSGHGFVADDPISFTTTGALPTGLLANITYWVISAGLTGSAFQLSATKGGTAIVTTGTQSGVHTVKPLYVPTAGTRFVIAEVWGCGGGSPGSMNNTVGGSGAGGYSKRVLTIAQIGASQVVTVGIPSTTSGTTTSFGAFLQATGGANSTSTSGGAGGQGSGGDLNLTGETGSEMVSSATWQTRGANAHFGVGFGGRQFYSNGAIPVSGSGYSSGVSGSSPINSSFPTIGTQGLVIITEVF